MILNSFIAFAEEEISQLTEVADLSETAAPLTETAEKAASGSPFAVGSGLILIVVLVALIVALVVLSSFKAQMKTAAKKSGAQAYAEKNTFRLECQSDFFLYESVERIPIQNNNNPPQQGGGKPAPGQGGKPGRV